MGIFIEDLLNFGNLIDAEIEIKLSPADLKRAYTSLETMKGGLWFSVTPLKT